MKISILTATYNRANTLSVLYESLKKNLKYGRIFDIILLMFEGVIFMNKKGFTLVELIATIALLGIVMGIAIYAASGGFSEAKNKTEDVFIKTLQDALNIYTDSDAKRLSFATSSTCSIEKRFGNANVYKNSTAITFNNVIKFLCLCIEHNV